jgi:alkanesulfonate monooxygenase SsuD/methylene tetrahydromethanopterin reductase-like flavin-dependent oxidoreductase (luciferase family)
MKFGIFDHLDRRDQPLGRFYEERLRFAAAADRLGITGYHIAEHHWNPVGMAPLPGVFLAAVAQRTQRLRFGPLGYALAFRNPLLLAEEICMLDHLSGGRFDLGIGRGISPWELQLFGIVMPETRDLLLESLEIMQKCFTSESVTHRGRRWQYFEVPMVLRPLQQPHPPLWYPTTAGSIRDYIARNGMNLVAGWAPSPAIKKAFDLYLEAWDRHKDDPLRAHAPKTPVLGSVRHVVVADTDAEADRIAKPARDQWYASLQTLSLSFSHRTAFVPPEYEVAKRAGGLIAGSPATVRAQLAQHIEETGVNYFMAQLAFGNLTHEQEMRSLELFAAEVMPKFG